jgi:glycosyltransferase involved in cell wall biosynthesis
MILEFIIPTYNRMNNLSGMLFSLINQNNKNWIANVVIDNEHLQMYDDIITRFQKEDRIKFSFMGERSNDFGHTPRNYGLKNSSSDWIIMTGDDNYYVPTFVNEVMNAIDKDVRFIYCDMIHNGYDYKMFNCHHSSHHIDIGNMVMKTELAKDFELKTNKIDADGMFCNDYINKHCKKEENIKKINKILYVHN